MLTIMAGFQVWRGASIDGALFFGLAALLVADRLTRGRIRIVMRPMSAPRWLLIVIGAALTIALVVAPRQGVVAFAIVTAIGVTMFVLAWAPTTPRPSRRPAAIRRSVLAWSIIGVALCVWEALAYILSVTMPGGGIGFPTVSLLLEPVVDLPATRAALIAVWLLGGLALLDIGRGRAPRPMHDAGEGRG